MENTSIKQASTVFIVDDNEDARDALAFLFSSVRLSVSGHGSAEDFLAHYQPQQAGCVVMDVRMPGMSGLQLHEMLNSRGFTIPVILVTAHADVSMAVRAMKNGAYDFLEKPLNEELLIERVMEAMQEGQQRQQRGRVQAEALACLHKLTPREKHVLQNIIAGKANKLIAYELNISEKTVETHRRRVMQKMKTKSLAELVRLVVNCEVVSQ